MFIPSAKSKLSLVILLLVAIILFIWSYKSRVFIEEKYFEEKLSAAQLMQEAEQVIREFRLSQNVFIDENNDPNKTALIGEKETKITTDRGSLESKLTTLNPNFGAVIVDYFKKAKLKKGDLVAVSLTASMPALNIAVMSAAKVLDLDLVIISSVGASMFGATDPDFTWLDIETLLYDKGIFPYKSIAASLGGGRDLGRGLSKIGRDLIIEAVRRNNVPLVRENSLEKNIQEKMSLFSNYSDKEMKLYVNIGGGLSSLGDAINGKLLSPGLHRYVSTKNIPIKGTMFLFAEKGIPILHLLNIPKVAEIYDLPIAPVPLPEPGIGKVFVEEYHNITVTAISLGIMIILIVIVILFDHKQQKFTEKEINIVNKD
ncbi:MAG: poly-gamma-glutamate system protein [Candidatus Cloacimonetes bacterium]|nr:poly-gamma-glutamate system protein [Candidatus Cloacimonadota bacterium]